ncbi:nascent polypeptide associated complex subunit-like protein, copy 2 [Leishmania major strain Friedlin]|uniref:Nascent polypeptide associated complex subunit-like protein, copy 2 n=1 Tax=Leishmania major TaxID=5664 RepID=O97212_LEIMA|nr:nascent polypeptide associated complex subunit-like protein, copy 2 [Leishmania major strain Friedlin]CAC22620.1 nascent polypeptide associated complex subunit-like protein, copy 2 [Leishmania major strain Friedlin]|eukprot:XP_888579.1 nascent polypeptide associated complex subunit-like protein, copy 2 [Leishmania major strain Friedlin]
MLSVLHYRRLLLLSFPLHPFSPLSHPSHERAWCMCRSVCRRFIAGLHRITFLFQRSITHTPPPPPPPPHSITMSVEEVQNAAAMADEEIPTLEAAEVPQNAKQSKRYAKAMAKMGLKPEPNITKVTIRKVGSLSFAMVQPEVYRFPGTNTFVIFGEAQLEDTSALAQEAAARAAVSGAASASSDAAASVPAAEEDDDEEVGAGDLDEKEINVVMSQANVSRSKAIKALKNNNGDIVNTIMELTM